MPPLSPHPLSVADAGWCPVVGGEWNTYFWLVADAPVVVVLVVVDDAVAIFREWEKEKFSQAKWTAAIDGNIRWGSIFCWSWEHQVHYPVAMWS